MVRLRSTVLCWIFPRDSLCSEFAFARAIISAYDRFLGGPLSVGLGRLTAGREGNGLLAVAGDFALLLTVRAPGLDRSFWSGLLAAPWGFKGLSLEAPRGRSTSRGDGLGEFPFGCEDLSAGDSVRAVLVPPVRSSSSAFRLGTTTLGRGAGFDVVVVGFSPVIDASRSRI
jgi:hypothetical protein